MMDRKYKAMVTTKSFDSWECLCEFYSKNEDDWKRWIYRGQHKSCWPLMSQLERAAVDRFQLPRKELREIEKNLLREFTRRYHHYGLPPESDQLIDWWALMQHHGAPTRLLDWTYSFWVAVFFALEHAKVGHTVAIWAFDPDWCRKRALQRVPESTRQLLTSPKHAKAAKTMRALFLRRSAKQFVWPVNPLRLNERLAVQQGVFLAAGDLSHSFMDNLLALYPPRSSTHPLYRLKFKCSKKSLEQALNALHKMNVTSTTLFPSLDGFARHLQDFMVMPHFYKDV